jgi:hypothetical protein
LKSITFECCRKCPYCVNDDGGGHCEPFNICDKYNILLDEKNFDLNRYIDLDEEIHPECELPDI